MPTNGADAVIGRLRGVLSAEEAARAARITHEPGRREYLAAHILCRAMLARFGVTPAAAWRFAPGPHGRPEAVADCNPHGLRFNLSHSHGMVACAVTPGEDIGVDVEWVKRRNRLDDIAEKKFSPPEAACLKNAEPAVRERTFFSFWTLKEAYIKAIGKGLLEPLDGFAFSLETLEIAFLRNNGDPGRWRFALSEPVPDYLLATAVARRPGERVDFFHRHLRPHELEDMIPP